ncbi:transposase [Candidatus Bathyarchaeota archaeon]|nr:transposase [Candidatus Bathyarchaeota archaeon]
MLGYKVHTVCCATSELPLAFTVASCNLNEKCFIKPSLEKLKKQNVRFKTVLADAQYNSFKIREAVKEYDAKSVMPYRKTPRVGTP